MTKKLSFIFVFSLIILLTGCTLENISTKNKNDITNEIISTSTSESTSNDSNKKNTISDENAGENENINGGTLKKCLPDTQKLDEIVNKDQTTIEQELFKLKARCNEKNVLVDGNNRQIKIYHLIGCWGMFSRENEASLQKQSEELSRLKELYTVIQVPCNVSGIAIP